MVEGAAACPLRVQRGRKGWYEALDSSMVTLVISRNTGGRNCRPVHGQPAIAEPPCLGGLVYHKLG